MPTVADMRDLVTLRRPVETRGAAGAVLHDWQDDREAWAHVAPLTGRERLRADQTEATVTHRIEMWADPDITAKWRLTTTDGRTYHLSAVIRPTGSQWMELLATEAPADG